MKMIFLSFFITLPSYALNEKVIIESVLSHFPLIEEAELKARAAGGDVLSAEGAFDHKINFNSRNRIEDKYDNQYFEATIERQTGVGGLGLIAGHRQGLGHFPAYDGKYETSGAGEIFAGISLPLLRNFKTDEFRTNLRVKRIERNQAEYQVKLKKMIYLHKGLSLYYKWILESQKFKINQSILELAKDRHQMIEKKYQAGDIERFKVIDNQRAIDKRSGDIIKNQISLNKIKAELGLYVRNKEGLPLEIPAEAEPENKLEKLIASIPADQVVENPQLQILALEKEKLQSESDLYEQLKLPGFNVELLGAKELAQNAPYDPERLQVALKFDLPIENSKAKGNSVAASYKILALEKNKQFLESQLLQQVSFLTKASLDSKSRWEIINQEFDGAKKMADAEKRRWDQGASDLFIVNLREQDVADVDINRWTALYDYHQYHLDAMLFSGRILSISPL